MRDSVSIRYAHTQKAPLCLILYGIAGACFLLVWFVRDTPGLYIGGASGMLIALLGLCFHSLSVKDQDDVLEISFGPIPLFRKAIRFDDIQSVETGRTLLLDGWGIHMSLRGGWVWNLWGRDCVVLHFKKGSTLRIGTDEAQNLADFLHSKVRV